MKPLLITDCDEVLLHMVKHFGAWVGEAHDIDFTPDGADFANSMRRRDGGPAPTREEMWDMLGGFFPAEMHRQTLVPHAAEALARLAAHADIVVLTNITDACKPRGSNNWRDSASRIASNATRAARAIRSRGWSPNMAIR